MNPTIISLGLAGLTAAAVTTAAPAPSPRVTNSAGVVGYKSTPGLPGTPWHVHDPDRPQPVVVTPGTFSSQETPGQPPSDAIVLFDGKDVAKWQSAKGEPTNWKVEAGAMFPGKGDIVTKQEFGDLQLHLEFCTPPPNGKSGQGRGNSGVFFMGRFELQVLDCYENKTYPDGQTGSLYGQQPPLVNACRAPGQWQTYDVAFTAPRFDADGKLLQPAYITAFHNGVLVQNHVAYGGPSSHKVLGNYDKPIPPAGPLRLQDHGDPVRFRNIWVRPIPPAGK